MLDYIKSHWFQIGLIWLATQNVLKAIQDALDAVPKDKPILTKIVAVMNAAGQYLFFGNRPTIGGQK